jgi:hypothetical protein
MSDLRDNEMFYMFGALDGADTSRNVSERHEIC